MMRPAAAQSETANVGWKERNVLGIRSRSCESIICGADARIVCGANAPHISIAAIVAIAAIAAVALAAGRRRSRLRPLLYLP